MYLGRENSQSSTISLTTMGTVKTSCQLLLLYWLLSVCSLLSYMLTALRSSISSRGREESS